MQILGTDAWKIGFGILMVLVIGNLILAMSIKSDILSLLNTSIANTGGTATTGNGGTGGTIGSGGTVNTTTCTVQTAPNIKVEGSSNAKVTIVEYSDFQCPYCGSAQPTIKQVMDYYEGKIKLQFKHFPLSFHQYAEKAAEAAECAADQGKFWEMHDMMFSNSNALTVDNLKQYAKTIGLDTSTFNCCLDSGKKAAAVQADMQEGVAAGVTGTPAFFINGKLVSGAQPYEVFKAAIDSALAS
jgi:protein-disulfide isomerase